MLQAMGISREGAQGTVRVSLGRYTRADEIETAVALIMEAWRGLVCEETARRDEGAT